MSENSSALERNEVGNGTLGREAWEDMEDTPRSEIPVSVKVSTPTTVTEEAATHAASNSADGYFTIDPASKEQEEEQEKNRQNALSSRLSISDGATSHKEQVPEGGLTEHGAERPVPHSTISSASIQSVDSAATVRAANSAPASRSSIQHRPPFPNQSYAALHNQQYPSPRQTLKQRSSHPGQILTFASAVASQHQSGSRTVGNSPAQTPGVTGLFHPQPPPTLPTEWDSPVTPNTYASPFLHFTQRVPPKETHIADVDVDPISGRKLINHYEIVDELGRGTHGKVKLGRDLSTENTFVAIKIVERFSKRRKLGRLGTKEDKVKKEVAILKQARHPNVVGLLEVIDDPSRKKVYIVLEWVERGEIQWRAKGAKEVCTVEARRYEREKNATHDKRSDAEDAAVLAEAQKRLARQRRRRQKTFRLVRRETPHGADASTSIELGDDESDVSDDDRLSLKSAESSYNSKLVPAGDRRASRTPSPLPPRVADVSSHSSTEASTQYYSVTSEPQSTSPVAVKKETSDFDFSGLEGTMYGPYMSTSAEHSRVPSLHSATSSRPGSKASSDNLAQTAAEVLDSDLDPELEYVPVMTMQQARITFRDTLLGLQYLHYQGIVHRDIKPPNLLATSNYRVKISDFGVSYLGRPLPDGETGEDVSEHEARDLDDEAKELAKTVGTPAFYAPELCITEPTDDVLPITKAIDVWALGVTLFCILFARTPFVDNEFVVMRQIAEEEVYIPRKRLKPVEAKSSSRPSSHGRAFPPTPAGLRNELELSYEDIGDELYDLLKRMLIKDPRKRITLEEVRHHPWLVADLQDKINWLNETDPSRQSQGKKIEVSKEDVNAAVVPLQFLDRVRSGIRKVGERLGIGGKTTSRGRSRSNVHGSDGSPPNSSSPSTTSLGQDGRRHSLRSDESILTALKASREGEHPLSRSMAASPEFENFDQHSATGFQRSDPTLDKNVQSDHITPPRPNPPDRANTIMTTSGSMRTVRQSDFPERNGEESPPPSPGLPGTPTAVDSSGGIGGMARRIFRTVRERSTARSADGRASSSDRGSVGSLDTHGEPSLAVSQTMATGHVNPPASFDEFSPTSSAHNSPPGSRPISAMSSPSPGGRLSPSAAEPVNLSRTSSRGSTSSMRQRAVLHNTTLSMSPGGSRSPVGLQHHVPRESTPEEWQRAKDEHVRKLIRENNQEDLTSNAFDDRTCPPSPDDQKSKHSESRRVSALDISNTESSAETSPTGQGARLPAAVASSTSDFGSAVSMSVSNPSIPSVISEASSVDLADTVSQQEPHEKRDLMSSDETVHDRPVHEEVEAREEEYHADDQEDAFSSGGDNDYDSSSDSDGGLVMSRRRSNARAPRPKDAEGSDPQPQSKVRRDTGQSARSRKSSRSDSNNTMVKVHSQEEGQEDYQQTPLESNDS